MSYSHYSLLYYFLAISCSLHERPRVYRLSYFVSFFSDQMLLFFLSFRFAFFSFFAMGGPLSAITSGCCRCFSGPVCCVQWRASARTRVPVGTGRSILLVRPAAAGATDALAFEANEEVLREGDYLLRALRGSCRRRAFKPAPELLAACVFVCRVCVLDESAAAVFHPAGLRRRGYCASC